MPLATLPESTPYLPSAGEPSLRWGVIGPGSIAGAFADAVSRHTAQRIVAVSSRSADRAAAFASEHGIERAITGTERLLADPDIDVVYIATPLSQHVPIALQAIAAGKHVLVEKPLAMSAADAQSVADAAAAAGVLAMEGMWTRYLPQASVLRQLLADGALGEIVSVTADHGQRIAGHGLINFLKPEGGGGALLDLGVYPAQLASQVFGTPTGVSAVGWLTDTGVDAYSTIRLTYDEPVYSTISTSMVTRTPMAAVIAGTEGYLEFAGPFYAPTSFKLGFPVFTDEPLVWSDPTGLRLFDALSWQATALATFVGEGRTDSPDYPIAENIAVLATLCEARDLLGVTPVS